MTTRNTDIRDWKKRFFKQCTKEPLAVASFFIAIGSFIFGYISLNISHKSYVDQTVQYSWGRLSSHMPGNSGISPALQFLTKQGEDLKSIDLRPFLDANADSEINKTFLGKLELPDGDLSHAWLNNTDLSQANLANANLRNVRAEHSIFANAVLINADLRNFRANDSNFEGAEMAGVTITNGIFKRANFTGVSMPLAVADNIDLTDSTLSNVVFDGSSMESARLVNSFGNLLSFVNADLSGAELQSVRFYSTKFQGANLFNVDFSDALIVNSDFSDANLSKANFEQIGKYEINMFKNAWAWDDQQPTFPIGEDILNLIKLYLHECREKWETRVKAEQKEISMQSTSDSDSINFKEWHLYRPPEEDCKKN